MMRVATRWSPPVWDEHDLVMWFDDDSYISDGAADFFSDVYSRFHASGADMLGQLWRMNLCGNQAAWVQAQPWFGGQPVAVKQKILFATGGWWVLKSELLQRYDWPPVELRHRGGDVMLGELCRQQQLKLVPYSKGVLINADSRGRQSASPRRGYDERPIGAA